MADQAGAQGVPVSLELFAKWEENIAAKKVKLQRDQQNFYTVVKRKYDPDIGTPAAPLKFGIDREGAEAMAKGLEQQNERLLSEVEFNKTVIAALRGPVLKTMDALDAEAKAAGDI